MRKRFCVPMILLCLLLNGCSTEKEEPDLREAYRTMTGCSREAVVSCEQDGCVWEARLRCSYVPGGESVVEILEPEELVGVRAVITDEDWQLEYEDLCLNIGTLSREELSPAVCLPRLMDALREGWLLEENRELWGEESCLRLTVDQTGETGGKILSTLWLREADGTPVRGEIAVDDEIILTAEFTNFVFCDTIN